MKTILSTLLLFTIMSSCSKEKGFEKDATRQTEQMYQQARSKDAEIIRQEKFSVLSRDDKDFKAKVEAATVYFKSFDFQLWAADKKNSGDIVSARLYADAVNEFTNNIDNIYDRIKVKKLDSSRNKKKFGDEQSFYALAVTMHMSPFSQGNYIDFEKNNKGLSIYDIIKSALLKDENGEILLDYEARLINGVFKEIMVNLIKARLDMMAAMAIDILTVKKDFTLKQRYQTILFKMSRGVLGEMNLPEQYNKLNSSDKTEVVIYLDAAVKAKNFLREIGEYEAEVNKSIKSALENIDYNEDRNAPPPVDLENQEESDLRRMEINDLINQLIR